MPTGVCRRFEIGSKAATKDSRSGSGKRMRLLGRVAIATFEVALFEPLGVSIHNFPDFSYSYSALAVLVLVLEDTASSTSTSTISLSTSTREAKIAQLQKARANGNRSVTYASGSGSIICAS
jgi:uncharacterized membrane-anchored protein YitT (DUF2179 family)